MPFSTHEPALSDTILELVNEIADPSKREKLITELTGQADRYKKLKEYTLALKDKVEKFDHKLEVEKRKYKDIFDYTPVNYLNINFDSEIVDINLSASTFLQYSVPTSEKKKLASFLDLENKSKLNVCLQKTLETKEVQQLRLTLDVNKQEKSILAYISVFFDIEYHTELFRVVIIDLTKHILHQAELEQSKLKYKHFVQHSMDGFLLTNEQGKVIELYENQVHEKASRLHPKNILNRYLWDIHFLLLPFKERNQDNYKSIKNDLELFYKTGTGHFLNKKTEFEYTLYNKTKVVQQVPFAISTSNGFQLGIIIRDITAIREQKKTAHLFASIVDNTNDICVIKDFDNKIITANAAFLKLIQEQNIKNIIGKRELDIFEALNIKHHAKEIKQITTDSGQTSTSEDKLVRPNGKIQFFQTRRFIMHDHNKLPVATAYISTDITEQQKAIQTQLNREKDFHLLVDNMLHGVIILRPIKKYSTKKIDFELVQANPQIKSMLVLPNSLKGNLANKIAQENESLLSDIIDVYLTKKSFIKRYHFKFTNKYFEVFAFIWSKKRLAIMLKDIDPQMKAEQAYAESQMQLVEAQKIAKIGHWSWDLKTEELKWSDEIYNIFGEKPDEFEVSIANFESKIHPDDYADFVKKRDQALLNDEELEISHRIILKNNEIKYVYERAQILKNAFGQAFSIFGTVQDVTQLVHVEKALQQSQQNYQQVFTNMSGSMALCKVIFTQKGKAYDYTFEEVNPEFEKTTGLSSAILVGKRATEIFPWITKQRIQQYAKIAKEGGSLRFQEHWEGIGKYFEVVAYSHKAGEIAFIYTDITQRINYEKQLRRTTYELETIFENAPVIMLVMNKERQVLKVNKTNEQVLQTNGEISSQLRVGELLHCINALHDRKQQCGLSKACKSCQLRSTIEEAFAEQKPIKKREIELSVDKGGFIKKFTVLISSVLMPDIKDEKVLISVDDITQEKQIEDALVENEDRYRRLADVATEAIVIHQGSSVIDVNSAFLKMFSKQQDEVIGQNLCHLIFPPNACGTVKENLQQQLNISFETECINNNNEIFPVEINGQPFAFRGATARVTAIRDISDAKLMQQRITKAIVHTEEKDRSFFARELHDGLGPLLSTAKIYIKAAEIAKDKERKGIALKKLEETIDESIASIREISSRLSPHILENFGLKVAIESFSTKLSDARNVKVNVRTDVVQRFDTEIELVIYRVFVELINNTLKHSMAKQVDVSLSANQQTLSLLYKDNGVGFDVEKAFTARQGIGLFNITHRVESFKGTCELNSSKGKGFRATIHLPIP